MEIPNTLLGICQVFGGERLPENKLSCCSIVHVYKQIPRKMKKWKRELVPMKRNPAEDLAERDQPLKDKCQQGKMRLVWKTKHCPLTWSRAFQ